MFGAIRWLAQLIYSNRRRTEITSDELEPGTHVVIGTTKAHNDDSGGSPFAPKMFGGGKK